MELMIIILIIIIVLGGSLILKFIKSVVKALFFIGILIVLLIIVFGVFSIQDVNNFKKEFFSKENTYVLVDGNKVITTFNAKGFDFKEITVGSSDLIKSYTTYYEEKNYALMQNNSFKLFIVNVSLIENGDLPPIELQGEKTTIILSRNILLSAIQSEDPTDALTRGLTKELEKQDLSTVQLEREERYIRAFVLNMGTNDEIRARAFVLLFVELIKKDSVALFTEDINSGEVHLYPENKVFNSISVIPKGLFESAKETAINFKDSVLMLTNQNGSFIGNETFNETNNESVDSMINSSINESDNGTITV